MSDGHGADPERVEVLLTPDPVRDLLHDLNNVLAPILMSVALLKQGESDPDRLETLDTIEASAQRGAALVRQALTLAPPHDDVGEVPPRGGNRTVLVVDDDERIRVLARKTLERHGYCVLVAQNGAEAVHIYTQHGPEISVVIMDMAMPVMDGPTAIKQLRTINPDVPVIASSGLESVGGAAKAIGVGSVLFIPKPYTADALLRAVGNAIAP